MSKKPGRRHLEFEELDDVSRDTQHLLASGYTQLGKWNLAQVCGHLNDWMRYPLDGFPDAPLLLRPLFWTMRKTRGPKILQQILREKSMKAGVPTMPATIHAADSATDEVAVNRLAETVKRFASHEGEVVQSPVFGKMDYKTARRLQLVHCAHHLGFLVPDGHN